MKYVKLQPLYHPLSGELWENPFLVCVQLHYKTKIPPHFKYVAVIIWFLR